MRTTGWMIQGTVTLWNYGNGIKNYLGSASCIFLTWYFHSMVWMHAAHCSIYCTCRWRICIQSKHLVPQSSAPCLICSCLLLKLLFRDPRSSSGCKRHRGFKHKSHYSLWNAHCVCVLVISIRYYIILRHYVFLFYFEREHFWAALNLVNVHWSLTEVRLSEIHLELELELELLTGFSILCRLYGCRRGGTQRFLSLCNSRIKVEFGIWKLKSVLCPLGTRACAGPSYCSASSRWRWAVWSPGSHWGDVPDTWRTAERWGLDTLTLSVASFVCHPCLHRH